MTTVLNDFPIHLTESQLQTLRSMAETGELARFGVTWIQFRGGEPKDWQVLRLNEAAIAAAAVAKAFNSAKESQSKAETIRSARQVNQATRSAVRTKVDRNESRVLGRKQREAKEEDALESSVVRIYRCSKVVKGGRKFSFGALIVAGDRKGNLGIGYGKANEVPPAVEKATKDARKRMIKVSLVGTTIPHKVSGRSGASMVTLVPARPGTGVTAGKSVRPCLELAGIRDVLSKAYGSNNPKNLVKATMQALGQLRTYAQVEKSRGVSLKRETVRHDRVLASSYA